MADILKVTLRQWMGPAFGDIDQITVTGKEQVDIRLHRPSQFFLESLEVPIRKSSSGSATGPFFPLNSDLREFRANGEYYLGRPDIDRITVERYPSVRSAWAEMLRDHVDMLYEVSAEALDSLSGATNTQVFTFTRHYQHTLVFNSKANAFHDRDVRRALNLAVDREEVVREGLNGHAVSSFGPISPKHWAFRPDLPHFQFDPQAAAAILGKRQPKIHFVCLVGPESDRIALVVKRQLETAGVDMEIREVAVDQFLEAFTNGDFDAVLTEFISGPALFRLYRFWHSEGYMKGNIGNEKLDAALDRMRYATSVEDYQAAVAGVQSVAVDDPPAIFIAWGERARAVNSRFNVTTEPGQDILSTLRLWRRTNDRQYVGRN